MNISQLKVIHESLVRAITCLENATEMLSGNYPATFETANPKARNEFFLATSLVFKALYELEESRDGCMDEIQRQEDVGSVEQKREVSRPLFNNNMERALYLCDALMNVEDVSQEEMIWMADLWENHPNTYKAIIHVMKSRYRNNDMYESVLSLLGENAPEVMRPWAQRMKDQLDGINSGK